MELEYTDLLYFGYHWEPESKKLQSDFIDAIKQKFEHVKLENAFDDIKGYRQVVHLDKESKDNFFAWLIGDGWIDCSMSLQLLMMSKEDKDTFMKYFNLAKEQYPDSFKKEGE